MLVLLCIALDGYQMQDLDHPLPKEVKQLLDKMVQRYKKVNIISIETQVAVGVNYRIKINLDDRIGSTVISYKQDGTVGYTKIQWMKDEL